MKAANMTTSRTTGGSKRGPGAPADAGPPGLTPRAPTASSRGTDMTANPSGVRASLLGSKF